MSKNRKRLQDIEPAEFMLIAAHEMRRMLIDYARKHRTRKRGGDFARVPLLDSEHGFFRDEDTVIALDNALSRLGETDRRALQVVELKFFAGCTNEETAQILGCSDGTVEAVWLHARLWLHRELTRRPATQSPVNGSIP